MDVTDLRIALFSGNYNYTRDGCNQALNRLADYLLRQGAALRVYSPVVEKPDFPPTGDLVDVPNMRMPVPRRGEYRLGLPLDSKARADLAAFAPNMVHLSAPDFTGHSALKWSRKRDIPVLASVHTRFETYPRYYNVGFLEPVVESFLRRFYHRCDALVAPSQSQIEELKAQDMHDDISLWSRGVDRTVFDPSKRDLEWRRANGLADDDVAIVFLGRLVMEKGLDVFAETIVQLRRRQIPHKVLVNGETGRLVEPDKPDAFAQACAEALAPYCMDDALRLEHGANGEKASRAYSWDAINQSVVDTYLRLQRQRGR